MLPALEHGLREPHPRVVLAELREQVVGHEAHGAGQHGEHDAEERLRGDGAPVTARFWGPATGDCPSPASAQDRDTDGPVEARDATHGATFPPKGRGNPDHLLRRALPPQGSSRTHSVPHGASAIR